MKTLTAIITSVLALVTMQEAAQAQYAPPMRGFYRPVPNVPQTLWNGVQGWHRFGWETGRYLSQRQYGVDPGNYPGFYARESWSRPW